MKLSIQRGKQAREGKEAGESVHKKHWQPKDAPTLRAVWTLFYGGNLGAPLEEGLTMALPLLHVQLPTHRRRLPLSYAKIESTARGERRRPALPAADWQQHF